MHRDHHRSRVNQSLDLLGACTFLVTYALLPFHPAVAAIFGWVVARCIRQVGHLFFEPRGYHHVKLASFTLGYTLWWNVILLSIWAALSVVLRLQPTLFGLLAPWVDPASYVVRLGVAWIGLSVGGVFARSAWLWMTHAAQTGPTWRTKILTDPINDVPAAESPGR